VAIFYIGEGMIEAAAVAVREARETLEGEAT
jgi:hypothetical protein